MAIEQSSAGGKRLPRTLLAVAAVAFATLAAGGAERHSGSAPAQAAQSAQPGLSSFNLSGYSPFPQQRGYPGSRADNFADDAADSVNGGADNFAGSTDILATMDSRLRGDSVNGGVFSAADLRKLLVHSANNNGGDAFDNLYKDAQLRLLSSLDDAFSAYATDALGARASIKSAGVRFQSALGGRKSQLGADIVGALREAEDEIGKYGIGWQAHVYAAEESNKGASGGLFYRRMQGDILYGVNAFADYENHNYGDFFRYGFGGEVQNRHIKLAANYYIPIDSKKRLSETLAGGAVLAYSREGYDANIQIAIPGARYVRAEAGYYRFDGIHQAAADTGFRYGGVLSPGMGVEAKVFYDGGGEELGGELSWRHVIGAPPQPAPDINIIAADIFAPVNREHSQRIALVTAAGPPPVRLADSLVFTIGVQGALGSIVLEGGSVVGIPDGVSINGNVLLLSAGASGARALTLTVANASITINFPLNVNVLEADPLLAGLALGHQGTAIYYDNASGTANRRIARITTSGGYLRQGSEYTYTGIFPGQSQGVFALSGVYTSPGNLTYGSDSQRASSQPVTATVIVDDDNEFTAPVSLFFTVTPVAPLALAYNNVSDGVYSGRRDVVGSLAVSGGLGDLSYNIANNPGFVRTGDEWAIMANVAASTRYIITMQVDDTFAQTPQVDLTLTVDAYPTLNLPYTCAVANCTWNTFGNVLRYTFGAASGGVGGTYVTAAHTIPNSEYNPPRSGAVLVSPTPTNGEVTFSQNSALTLLLGYILNDDSSHPHAAVTPAATITVTVRVPGP